MSFRVLIQRFSRRVRWVIMPCRVSCYAEPQRHGRRDGQTGRSAQYPPSSRLAAACQVCRAARNLVGPIRNGLCTQLGGQRSSSGCGPDDRAAWHCVLTTVLRSEYRVKMRQNASKCDSLRIVRFLLKCGGQGTSVSFGNKRRLAFQAGCRAWSERVVATACSIGKRGQRFRLRTANHLALHRSCICEWRRGGRGKPALDLDVPLRGLLAQFSPWSSRMLASCVPRATV